jgi:hypothetical protein
MLARKKINTAVPMNAVIQPTKEIEYTVNADLIIQMGGIVLFINLR